jgi:hypothetical protein
MIAMTTAVSGLSASTTRLLASASNLANQNTRGPLPEVAPAQPVRRGGGGPERVEETARAYQPVEAVQTAREDKAASNPC